MRAITYEFQGKTPEEADSLIYTDAKTELGASRQRQTAAQGELREVENQLNAKSFDAHDSTQAALRERGRDLRDELVSLDRRIAELEPAVAQLTAARKTEAARCIPAVKSALDKLSAALDAVAAASAEVERQRVDLHAAGGSSFRQLPQLTLPGCKTLVQKAMVELESAR